MSIFPLIAFVLPLLVGIIAGSDTPTDLSGFPQCAQTCISNNHGDCALLDMACMCNNQVPTIFSCMQGSCNAEDQATTLNFAQELCDQVNATSTAKISGASKTGATTLSTAVSTNTEPASSPSSSPASASSGLSTAATAGVGVGAALGAVALAAGGFFFWRRKRLRASDDAPAPTMRTMEQDYTLPPAYGQKAMVHHVHHEVDGVQWMELEAKEATRFIR